MEGQLTLESQQFENIIARIETLMHRLASQAQEVGARINQNLFRGSGAAAESAANATQASMGRMRQGAAAAGQAAGQAGARAGAAAAGYQRNAAAANLAGGAALTFGQKTGILFARLGQLGNNIAGISNGVKAIAEAYRRFRGTAGPVQQAANATTAAGAAANAAAPAQTNLAERLLKIIKVSSAAGLAIFGLVKAYKDLGNAGNAASVPDVGKKIQQSLSAAGPGIGAAVSGIVAMIAAALAAVGIGKIITDSVSTAVDAETLMVRMEVLVGGATEAQAVIDDLRKRSGPSPFTAVDYTSAGANLIAFGEDAKKVGATLDRIGDITAGTGGKSQQFGEIAEIYGKARVQTQLFAEDINQLTGRGIPVLQEFAKILGVTPAAVKKLASEGQVTFPMLEQAFTNLTSNGGKFEGLAVKLGKTTGGLWSTMLGEIQTVMLALGQPINDQLRPMLSYVVDQMGKVKTLAAGLGGAIGEGLQLMVTGFQDLGTGGMITVIRDGMELAFKGGVNVLYAGIQGSLAVFGAGLGAAGMVFARIFEQAGKAEFWQGLKNVLMGIGRSFVAVLLDGIASMMEGVRKIPGMGIVVGSGPEQLRASASALRSGAGNEFKTAGDQLKPVLDEANKQFTEFLKALPGAFQESFGNAADIFDIEGLETRMQDLLAGLREQMKRIMEAAKGASDTAKEKDKEKEAAGKVIATPGMFASAVNLIMGRAPGELLLDEARRQTKLLGDIANNTNQTPKPPPKVTEAKPVDMTPRFN